MGGISVTHGTTSYSHGKNNAKPKGGLKMPSKTNVKLDMLSCVITEFLNISSETQLTFNAFLTHK